MSVKIRLSHVRILLAGSLYFVASVFGQTDNTQISGFVRDSSGGAIVGVKVTARNEERGFERFAATNEQGYYVITNLPPGKYSLSASVAGFKKFQANNKKLDPNLAAVEDLVLQVGSLNETISVNAPVSGVQSETATLGKLVEGKQLQLLQLNGRNPLFLAMLKPGVSGANLSGFSFGLTAGSLNINGSRVQDNLLTFDGAIAIRTRSNSTTIGVADVDSVQEVQILTANYNAEFGRGSGGQIRIVTKSGSRDFHGNFYEYGRNNIFDANTWSRNKSYTGLDRPCSDPKWKKEPQCSPESYRYNQFGFNLGGPIVLPASSFNQNRSKLFWFYGMEWVRYRRDLTNIQTVPSLKMRNGDFSELLEPSNRFFGKVKIINDPRTKQPFAGNIIPADRLSSNGIAILRAFPEPAPGYTGPGSANLFEVGSNWTNQRKDSFSIDYYPNPRHAIRWRAQLYHYTDYNPFRGGTNRVPGGADRPNQTTSLSWVWTLSPSLINEFLATGSRDQSYVYVDTSQGYFDRTKYGINYPYIYPDRKEIPNRIPTVDISNFVVMDGGPYPSSSKGPIYVVSDQLTKIWRNHTFKSGFSFEKTGENDFDQINITGIPGGTNNQNGRFEFRDVQSGLSTGLAVANAAMGLFNSYAEIGVRSYTPYRGLMFEWFLQDSWKVSSKWRAEYGIRHTIIQPYYSLWRNMVVFDPSSYDPRIAVEQDPKTGFITAGDLKSQYNGLTIPGDGWSDGAHGRIPISDTGQYDFMFRGFPKQYSQIHLGDFQPRVGLAYSVTSKTVIRSGVGRFMTRLGVSDSVFLGGNPPLQPMASISSGMADYPGGGGNRAYALPITTQDPVFRNPESWVWNVTAERQLTSNTSLEVSYVGRRGLRGQRERNINQLPEGTLTNPANKGINPDYLRPFKGFSYIRMTTNDANSRYNGLEVGLTRRFSKGLSYGMSYTYSKTSDNGSAQRDLIPDAYNADNLWGAANYDRRHVMVANLIWELPFWRSSRALKSKVLGGWTASFTSQWQTGNPFSVYTSDDFAGVGPGSGAQFWVVNTDPANLVLSRGDRKFSENNSDNNYWFKIKTPDGKDAFARPATGAFNKSMNVRDILYNPGAQYHNMGLFKDFHIREQHIVQLRFEAFNWPNHPNWGGPSIVPTSANFGKVQSKSDQRGLQFALRYSF